MFSSDGDVSSNRESDFLCSQAGLLPKPPNSVLQPRIGEGSISFPSSLGHLMIFLPRRKIVVLVRDPSSSRFGIRCVQTTVKIRREHAAEIVARIWSEQSSISCRFIHLFIQAFLAGSERRASLCCIAQFSYAELERAAGGFSEENLIGSGGSSEVYRGRLTDGRLVAIKKLKLAGCPGADSEFMTEVSPSFFFFFFVALVVFFYFLTLVVVVVFFYFFIFFVSRSGS